VMSYLRSVGSRRHRSSCCCCGGGRTSGVLCSGAWRLQTTIVYRPRASTGVVADVVVLVRPAVPGKRRRAAETTACRPSASGTRTSAAEQRPTPGRQPSWPARDRPTTAVTGGKRRPPTSRRSGMETITDDKSDNAAGGDDDAEKATSTTATNQTRWSRIRSTMLIQFRSKWWDLWTTASRSDSKVDGASAVAGHSDDAVRGRRQAPDRTQRRVEWHARWCLGQTRTRTTPGQIPADSTSSSAVWREAASEGGRRLAAGRTGRRRRSERRPVSSNVWVSGGTRDRRVWRPSRPPGQPTSSTWGRSLPPARYLRRPSTAVRRLAQRSPGDSSTSGNSRATSGQVITSFLQFCMRTGTSALDKVRIRWSNGRRWEERWRMCRRLWWTEWRLGVL